MKTLLALVLSVFLSLAPPRLETGLGNETGVLPKDRILQDQIRVGDAFTLIDVPNLEWAVIDNSTSMLPVLGSGTHVLQGTPSHEAELQVGDIVSINKEGLIVIHRIIDIGKDEQGWYAITKGDNNAVADGKVRFNQIDRVLVGIIY